MFADYNYYTNEFGGTKIKNENEYKYLGQQACKYIEKYTKEKNDNTKACECAISEVLQASLGQSNITSESIPNAYSVSYSENSIGKLTRSIDELLSLYLGDEIFTSVGTVRLIG